MDETRAAYPGTFFEWGASRTMRSDLDFALVAAPPGMMGIGGDLSCLSPDQRKRIGEVVAFYKRWRRFIVGARAHLPTPQRLDRLPVAEPRVLQ